MAEVLTLAHAGGHARSYLRGIRSDRYHRALDRLTNPTALTADEKHLILGEEALAWALGGSELAALGFRDWEAFGARADAALARYFEKLGIDSAESTARTD
jgi:hypothetical protein